jgi:hypothetical protein
MMKVAVSVLFILILTFTVQNHNINTQQDYQLVSNAHAQPDVDKKERIKSELEEMKNNKKKLNEIEIQQKSIHKNLEELKMLVKDKCKKQKANQ